MNNPGGAPLVAVDIGNSSTRCGLFAARSGDAIPPLRSARSWATGELVDGLLGEFLPPQPLPWRIASVCRQAERKLRVWVRRQRPRDDYRLLEASDLPLAVEVEQPQRVGMDRLAAAVAVNRLRSPARPAIVVDAGTAITVDLVSAAGAFQGGVILPGFQMTARALAQNTDLLPLIDYAPTGDPPPVVGKATEAAIQSGLFWGTVGAVRELVRRMARQLPEEPQLFVTGGDAQTLTAHLDPSARYLPNLVLLGIALAAETPA